MMRFFVKNVGIKAKKENIKPFSVYQGNPLL